MTKRGFTIYFAVLIASLSLAVGLAIYDLLIREISLSQVATQSEYAIYAADTGAECALYWAQKYVGNGGDITAFATSSLDTQAAGVGAGLTCNGASQDITKQGPPSADWSQYNNSTYGCPSSPSSAWCVASSATAATTTFSITIPSTIQTYCATVIVAKWGNPPQTTIISHGYNTCSNTGVIRLERALQVSY